MLTFEFCSAATTYAFDVVVRSGGVFLANKRVFAYVSSIPMCITCDSVGNVYIGCAAGVEIFNAGGGILGVIEVPGKIFVQFIPRSVKRVRADIIQEASQVLLSGRGASCFCVRSRGFGA